MSHCVAVRTSLQRDVNFRTMLRSCHVPRQAEGGTGQLSDIMANGGKTKAWLYAMCSAPNRRLVDRASLLFHLVLVVDHGRGRRGGKWSMIAAILSHVCAAVRGKSGES